MDNVSNPATLQLTKKLKAENLQPELNEADPTANHNFLPQPGTINSRFITHSVVLESGKTTPPFFVILPCLSSCTCRKRPAGGMTTESLAF